VLPKQGLAAISHYILIDWFYFYH